jgi:hypothetical protein
MSTFESGGKKEEFLERLATNLEKIDKVIKAKLEKLSTEELAERQAYQKTIQDFIA